ncbi:macrophage mannose receptor 1-like [Patagioenas fasciata monilis]|uniref:Macrophage mannose receptor 1-like n=1 Tax=Patagioenas fasciata monilis TaxID=372326 RepID=A0A1V4KK69_PATFA|nr:macrophage mannose receptor 1-like [Patagioenas fasciata monilis]
MDKQYHRTQQLAVRLQPRGILYTKLTLVRQNPQPGAPHPPFGSEPPNFGSEPPIFGSEPRGFGSEPRVFGSEPRVFGVELRRLVERENSPTKVPLLIQKCVAEIERRGLKVVGLYRLCGSAAVKKELRDAFERDSAAVTLSERRYPDINVVTGCPPCSKGWTYFQNSCYFYSKMANSWENAQNFCSLLGSQLLEVDGPEEKDHIRKMLEGSSWLGIRDSEVEGTWKRTNGTVVTPESRVSSTTMFSPPPHGLHQHHVVSTTTTWSPPPPRGLHHHHVVSTTTMWSPPPPCGPHHHHVVPTTTRFFLPPRSLHHHHMVFTTTMLSPPSPPRHRVPVLHML